MASPAVRTGNRIWTSSFLRIQKYKLAKGPIGVRRMSTEDPGGLEIQRIFIRHIALLVLVFDAEAQKFAPVPTHIGRDAPHFLIVRQRVLGPVQPQAEIPVPVELLLGQ